MCLSLGVQFSTKLKGCQHTAVVFQPATATDLDVLLAMVRELYCLEHILFDEQIISAALSELLRQPTFGRLWLVTAIGAPEPDSRLSGGIELPAYLRGFTLEPRSGSGA